MLTRRFQPIGVDEPDTKRCCDMLRGLIAFFDLPMSDFARGPSDQAMLQAKGYQIAPFICYEVVYPEFAAGLSAQSDLLLTISNDTWFGTSIGPLQHLQMAQMRALEAGRWMIRATNNGVTGLINPYGQITAQIPQFERGILYGEVVPMHELTPYLQWRSWPLIVVCLALFGCHGLHARATLHDFIAWLHGTSYTRLAWWHAPGGATAGLRKGGGSGQTHGQNGRLYWETHCLLLLKER